MNRLFEEFLIFKAENEGRSDRTVRAYRDVLVRFEAFLEVKDPLKVSPDDLLVFCGPYAHKQGLSAVSRTPWVAAIREFYRWAHSIKSLLPANLADPVTYPKKGRRLPRVMSLQSAERLMWAPDFNTFEGIRDAAMLSVLIGCGLRVAGLIGLNTGDLVPLDVAGEIRLAIRTLEKGQKERLVPIPREADLILRVYLEHSDLAAIDRALPNGDLVLFVSTRNRTVPYWEYRGEARRFSQKGVWKMIQRHGASAGIPADQLHPHAMRHLFGTELAEGDVDLLTRQQLMGHADPKSTEIYTHLAARKLVGSIDAANPLGKIKTPMSQLLAKL